LKIKRAFLAFGSSFLRGAVLAACVQAPPSAI